MSDPTPEERAAKLVVGDTHRQRVAEEIRAAEQAAREDERDEAERECIQLVCWYCGNHDQAKRLKSGVIGHKKPDWQRGRRCEAAPIYELRRRHGERVEVGDE